MSWIQTFTGKTFDFKSIEDNKISISDIAHALANQCRFNGHTQGFYSVARHSIVMAKIMLEQGKDEEALIALMHDATEAYVGGMVKPLKNLIPEFERFEQQVWELIARRYELPYELPESVKSLDLSMLKLEREKLLGPHPAEWAALENAIDISDLVSGYALCSNPESDERDFLMLFYHIREIISDNENNKSEAGDE